MWPTIVLDSDIENTSPRIIAVTTSAVTASDTRLNSKRRTSFVIIPYTAGTVVTVVKGGDVSQVVANGGIPLTANQPYAESDSDGSQCYQGPIHLIGSAAGNVGFTETFAP